MELTPQAPDFSWQETPEARALIDNSLVGDHIQRATEHVVSEVVDAFRGDLFHRLIVAPSGRTMSAGPALESPLEAVFEVWARARRVSDQSRFWYHRQVDLCGLSGARYRADFQAVYSGASFVSSDVVLPLLVELDGHAFHEKTKQQVERRNTRDRDLSAAGFTLLHFSFSEFTRDPMDCLEQVEISGWKCLREIAERTGEQF